MLRRCEPLHEDDPGPHCGQVYNDEHRWTLCPHPPLDQPPPRAHPPGRDRMRRHPRSDR